LPTLHGQPKFFNHLNKLFDLIGLRFSFSWLQAKRPRYSRMAINMVAPANSAQFESECLNQSAKLGEPDIPNITTEKTLP
jgi:hypothetical protein